MSTKWFERKFAFDFDVALLPGLLARLRGTPTRLEEQVRGVPHDVLIARHGETWSAQENAGHLLDLEPLWLARVEDFVRGAEVLTPTDLQNRRTDESRFNERDVTEILTGFRAARGLLLARVEALDVAGMQPTIVHPRMKVPMRLVDHLFFVAEHDDHHLARMDALVRG